MNSLSTSRVVITLSRRIVTIVIACYFLQFNNVQNGLSDYLHFSREEDLHQTCWPVDNHI